MSYNNYFIPDKPIAFNRDFVSLGIGITGALFLSQCVYWSKRTKHLNDWFYKTIDDWEDETGLTRYEQETARKKLKSLGLIEEKKQGIPAKLYYKIVPNKIMEMLQTSLRECNKLDSGNTTNSIVEIPQTLYKDTENTTENNITVESEDYDLDNSLLENKKEKITYSENFEILWNKYDKKTGNKARAYKIYLQKHKNKSNEQILEAMEKYKLSLESWRTLKDFDGFLNGVIDIYLPKRAWIIDRDGKKHLGYFYDSENRFVSDELLNLKLESSNIAEHIADKRFGYIGA